MPELSDHSVRMDLRGMYERLERYTSLRARMMVDENAQMAANIVITESDSHTINPLISLSCARLSDDLGMIRSFDVSGLDALTDSGLRDWKQKAVDGDTDVAIYAIYNLPNSEVEGYVPAFHEFIYEAIVSDILSRWFGHIGLHDISRFYEAEYQRNKQQAINITPRWASAPRSRPTVNL